MENKIYIVGAGIGGLTSALTLKKRGLKAHIFESSKLLKPVGAGLILANNAMQVYKDLGLKDKIENTGNRISYMKITDTKLRPLSITDLTKYEKKYQVHNIAIHRGELQKILAGEVGMENISLGKRLLKVEKADEFTLTFEDSTYVKTKILIGADGINSVVRKQLFPASKLRSAGQICWRGVCEIELPQKYQDELNEAWGNGKRFGFVKIGDKKVYWYALINASLLKHGDISLSGIFADFHDDILSIVSATDSKDIIMNEISDLKPIERWQDTNVCLIGDAAHATSPNLGQGACQAIEDSYILGKLLDKGLAIENTFLEYEKIRRKKVDYIVKTSWMLGKVAHVENNFGVMLRNMVIENLPKSFSKKQLDIIFNLD